MNLENWHHRSKSEKITITIGASLIGLFCVGYFIFYPLHKKETQLYNQAQYQKELLTWMESKAPLLKASQPQGGSPTTSRELFSLLEEKFKKHSATEKFTLTRITENKVNINFSEVAFDDLINQLADLWKREGIDVDEAQINRMDKAGLVEGKVVLVKNK